jgi:pyruvate/2-oxoglutarate/acetoin dehydrogenase E1 component
MENLAKLPNVIFLGQQVGAEDFYRTLTDISPDIRIEMPVAEELQMGISIGLALEGYLPISIYQRMDFLPRACDQIVNHLDLIEKASRGKFKPKVIIRTTVGATSPFDVGPQHNKNLMVGFANLVTNINVWSVTTPKEIVGAYNTALTSEKSSIIIEFQDLYGNK